MDVTRELQTMCKYLMLVVTVTHSHLVTMQASGAAPLPRSVLDFFEEFDIPIYVLYGMSESTGPQTFNYEGERECVCMCEWVCQCVCDEPLVVGR